MYMNIYFLPDIICYFLQALLLVYLLQPFQCRFNFQNRYTGSVIIIVQYIIVRIFLYNIVKTSLYGSNEEFVSSRQSVVLVLISVFITYAACRIILCESRLKTGYYVITFSAVTELAKFFLYTFLVKILEIMTGLNGYFYFEKQMYDLSVFMSALSVIQFLWNIAGNALQLILVFFVIKRLKQYHVMEEPCRKWQQIFLMFPSTIGLVLCVIIRSIMFSIKGTDIRLLQESYPEMKFLIPFISLLCIIMIIIAARVVQNLIDESNKRIEVGIYKSRIEEMEKHVEDIENLYAGIRGMRHDMKNYIADMDALIKQSENSSQVTEALQKYLSSLQISVDKLDIKFRTGNPVTDVVVQRYAQSAQKNGIAFQSDFIFPADMNIDAFDLSIILNNGLENALEACKRQQEEKRYIKLAACRRENIFFISIQNSFNGILSRTGDKIHTTKKDSENHGFGLINIEACAEKYFGRVETSVKDGYFELTVMLQKQE